MVWLRNGCSVARSVFEKNLCVILKAEDVGTVPFILAAYSYLECSLCKATIPLYID